MEKNIIKEKFALVRIGYNLKMLVITYSSSKQELLDEMEKLDISGEEVYTIIPWYLVSHP